MLLILLAIVGVVVGALGTLIGSGGGFIVVPLLILAFGASPAMAAGTSLVMVTVNSFVGTLAYARQGKIDWRGGLFLSATAYPGTLLGAWVGTRLPAAQFTLLFGLTLLTLAAWMVYKTLAQPTAAAQREVAVASESAGTGESSGEDEPTVKNSGWCLCRRLAEVSGPIHAYCFILPLGALLSFAIGFAGAMLGIGGGPLLVPAMIYALHYPVFIATATSQFIKALTSVGAAAIYLHSGHLLVADATALSLGTVAGAPLGAWLSRKVNSRQLMLLLAVVLLSLGVRLLVGGAGGH